MDTIKRTPLVEHHPKAPQASIEELRRLSGIVTLKWPVPDAHFLDESTVEVAAERARD